MLRKLFDSIIGRVRKPIRDAIKYRVNVDLFFFKNEMIPDYATYWRLLTDRSPFKNMSRHFIIRATTDHFTGHNLITDYGLNQFGNLIAGINQLYMRYNGVGSSSTAAQATDTDLITAIGSRKEVTNRYVINNVIHIDTHYLNTENNGTWRELIISEASSGANASARYVMAANFTKDTTKSALAAWTITAVNA